MNRLKTIFTLLPAVLLWTGCSDDKEIDRAEIRPISLTAEQHEVVITHENAAQTALTYTWSDASRYTGEAAYTLEINLKDAPDAKARTIEGITSNSRSFTGEELQQLITGTWGALAGEPATLTARVMAVVGKESVNISATVPTTVTTYASVLPLTLDADPQTVLLTEADADKTAVAFSWSDENTYDGNATYHFALDIMGNEFAAADVTEGMTETRKSYTVGELNDLLTETWTREPGKLVTLEARVAAYVGSEQKASSAVAYIDVTPYGATPVYTALSLFGSATPGGTDAAKAAAMTRDSDDSPLFTWRGVLEAGSLRLLCNPDGTLDVDQLIAAEADKQITPGRSEAMTLARTIDPARKDYMWKIAQAGEYTVTADTEQRTILFTLERSFYSAISMVGPATPNGWEITQATPLVRNGRVFTWEGTLNVGTLRLACDPDGTWNTDQYIAAEQDKPVVSGAEERLVLAAVSEQGRGDYMWKINVPGTWAISADTEAGTIVFTLKNSLLENCTAVHMVGPATPNGWDSGAMTALTASGTNWEWTGRLTRGEMKFVCNRTPGNDWGDYQLLAAAEADPVTPENETKPFACTPADDNKWDIRTPGEYRITIDMQQLTVTFHLVKSDAEEGYPSLGLIGGAAPQGWGFDYSQSTLTHDSATGLFTWTGHLNEGDLNIMCDVSDTNWGSPRLTAQSPDTEVASGETYRMLYKENDNKWLIRKAGTYTVQADLHTMRIVFTLDHADE